MESLELDENVYFLSHVTFLKRFEKVQNKNVNNKRKKRESFGRFNKSPLRKDQRRLSQIQLPTRKSKTNSALCSLLSALSSSGEERQE